MDALPFDHAESELLRRIAIIEPDRTALEHISRLASLVQDWQRLVAEAEQHGLSNLLSRQLAAVDYTPPEMIRQQLSALKIRHRRANDCRMVALAEILQALGDSGIPSAVLKGAALVNMIYPGSELRPMGDIDILVPKAAGLAAQECVRQLGFVGEDRRRGVLSEHHHLPALLRIDNGQQVAVEIHTDALSGDTGATLDWTVAEESLQTFQVRGIEARSLGDTDMLRHLCYHAFEPAETFKLIHLADIYGYAFHFRQRIPWGVISDRYPMVTNILILLACLAPPPDGLDTVIPAPQIDCPPDTGRGYPPLSVILSQEGNWWSRARRLFSAPEWWLRCYYNVPPEESLVTTRLLRHPSTVSRWLLRRMRAAARDLMR